MKKLSLFLFSFFIYGALFSQNLLDGYVITNANDTIFGQIDLRSPAINQEKCVFIPNAEKEQVYYPGEIKGYRLTKEDRFYISKEVTIDKTHQPLIFVESLVLGDVNLYYFENGSNKYFLFEEQAKDPLYITQKPSEESSLGVKHDYRYRGQLKYYFRDGSSSLHNLIDKSKFSSKAMMRIIEQYIKEKYTSSEAVGITYATTKSDRESVKLKFSAYTGIQNTIYEIDNVVKESSLFPVIGGQIYICNPTWSRSFGAVADLSVSKMKKDFSFYDKEYNKHYPLKYDSFTLMTKIGFRYTYTRSKLKPSLDAGGAYLKVLNNKLKHVDNPEVTEKMKSSSLGGYFGAGLEYDIAKEQSIFLRFNYDLYSKSIFGVDRRNDGYNAWQVKIGYTF